MNFSRRRFAQALGIAPLAFTIRAAIATPLLRPIFPNARSLADLEQALRDAGFTSAHTGYNRDQEYLWSRVTFVSREGEEWHDLMRRTGTSLPLNDGLIKLIVNSHKMVRDRHRRMSA